VEGYGLFTIPHGPVRSGVLKSIEYLVETPGEAIPHLNMRVFYKHRGVARRFTGMRPTDAVLLAERAEGIASVAHALAFCHAVERIAGCAPPPAAALIRVLHAELERIANHIDVAVRLADAAGLAVATARLALHKERVMRLVSRMSGSRFGRGVVVPGGVSAPPRLAFAELRAEVEGLAKHVTGEASALMATSSFLDRLRGTGPLTPARARAHGALGPIGKAAGFVDDNRLTRPYDGYPALAVQPARAHEVGDALIRLRVRWEEVDQSFGLIRQATEELAERTGDQLRVHCEPAAGRALGWAEAPQGEVLYDVALADGRVVHCQPRSASFHNLVLMHEVFTGDILTDPAGPGYAGPAPRPRRACGRARASRPGPRRTPPRSAPPPTPRRTGRPPPRRRQRPPPGPRSRAARPGPSPGRTRPPGWTTRRERPARNRADPDRAARW
jgi:formate hydrogenlyase subunit 5